MIHGTGSSVVNGHALNLYNWGAFAHPFEFDEARNCLCVMQNLLANLIGKFKQ